MFLGLAHNRYKRLASMQYLSKDKHLPAGNSVHIVSMNGELPPKKHWLGPLIIFLLNVFPYYMAHKESSVLQNSHRQATQIT